MGDEDFALLHDAAERKLFAYVAARVGYAEAADVMSEVFEVAWRKKKSAPPDRDTQIGWLFGIAKNKIRQEWSRQKRTKAADIDDADGPVAADHADAIAEADHGARIFRGLSPSDQRLFTLLFIEQFSREQVCKLLGINLAALYTRASRLRDRIEALSEALDSTGEEGIDERSA